MIGHHEDTDEESGDEPGGPGRTEEMIVFTEVVNASIIYLHSSHQRSRIICHSILRDFMT